MEVSKSIKVPVKIQDSMLTDETVEQESKLFQISEVEGDYCSYYVFGSDNFFGHGITAGFRVEKAGENLVVFFKAAICSPEDRYRKETGEEIVLGRLIKADRDKPATSLYVEKMTPEEVSKTITNIFTNFLSSFGALLIKRDETKQLTELSIQLQNRTFKEAFSKYK